MRLRRVFSDMIHVEATGRCRAAGKSSDHLERSRALVLIHLDLDWQRRSHCFLSGRTTNSDNVATYASNKRWREMRVKVDIAKATKHLKTEISIWQSQY